MIVEFLAAGECMAQRGQDFARPLKNFRDWVDEPLVIARLMPFDRWGNRCQDVCGTALFRQKNLNARACGLCRFDKDKLVFVRNDHGPVPEKTGNTTQSIGRLVNAREYARN